MNSLKSLLVFCLVLISCSYAKASHVMGTDIKWECLGKDSFKITVTAYRDCNGIGLSGGGINLVSQCNGQSYAIGGDKGQAEDITPTCEEACTRCTDPGCTDTRFGIHRIEVTANVKIDRTNCCKWKITWGQCCRNGAITTGAGNANFYSEAWMDLCAAGGCDNSPAFTTPTATLLCKNQCFVYNPAVHDIDSAGGEGDSLFYRLAEPLQEAGTTIPYYPGYSYDEPLSYAGDPNKNTPWDTACQGFHFDSLTGELKFKPTKEEQTVMVIEVEEWRKDSTGTPRLIGIIRRDIQMAVIDCPPNAPPSITTKSGNFVYTFCANQSNCIELITLDADSSDTVDIVWNDQIASATFTIDSSNLARKGAKFCWTPDTSNIRSLPYQFIAAASDNACPYPGRTARAILINVVPSPVAAFTHDSLGLYNFKFIPADTTAVSYFWSFGDGDTSIQKSPEHTWTKDSTYNVSLTVTNQFGCKTTYINTYVINHTITDINSLNEGMGSWKVYPNPIKNNRVMIEAPSSLNESYSVSLYDIKGRKIAEKLHIAEGKTVLELPHELQPGNYILRIQAGETYTTELIVK